MNNKADPHQAGHQWIKVGEELFTCTVCGLQKDHVPGWRDMATAPRDGTMLRLLVNFTDHSTSDHGHNLQAPTIGYNLYDDCAEDRWNFAGENWDGSGFTDGQGEPVGWLPMLDVPKAQTQPATKEMEQRRKNFEVVLRYAENINTEAAKLHALMLGELGCLEQLDSREVPNDH